MKKFLFFWLLLMSPLFRTKAQEWSTVPAKNVFTSPPTTDYVGTCGTFSYSPKIIWRITSILSTSQTVAAEFKRSDGVVLSSGGTYEVRKDNACGTLVKSGSYSSGSSTYSFLFKPTIDAEYVLVLKPTTGGKYYAKPIDFNYTACSSSNELTNTPSPSLPAANATVTEGNINFYIYNYVSSATKMRLQISTTLTGHDVSYGWHCDVNDMNYTNSTLVYNSDMSISGTGNKIFAVNLSPGTYYFSARVANTIDKTEYFTPRKIIVEEICNIPSTPSITSTLSGDRQVIVYFTSPTADRYHIYRDGSYVGNTTNSSYTVTGLTNGTEYSFSVRAYNTCGEYSGYSTAVKATPCPTPSASFSYSPTTVYVNEAVSFTSTSSGGTGVTVSSTQWDFDNNGTWDSYSTNSSYTFTSTGNKTVKLRVNNACGKYSETTKTITVLARPQSITVSNPNTYVEYNIGDQIHVQWSSSYYSDPVAIKLLDSSGNVVKNISSSTSNDGSFYYTLPDDLATGLYKIQVKAASSASPSDVSDVNFKIFGKEIWLTYPAGGEYKNVNKALEVQWDSRNLTGNVDIALLDENKKFVRTIVNSTPNDKSYLFNLFHDIQSGRYIIRVTDTNTETVIGYSNIFNIVGMGIVVVKPNGGELLDVGDQLTVELNSLNYSGNFNVYLKNKTTGQRAATIAENTSNYDLNWQIPYWLSTGQYVVEITDTEGYGLSDESNASFTITAPDYRITNPNASTTVQANQTYVVKWTTGDLGGTNDLVLLNENQQSVETITNTTSNDGSFEWFVSLYTPPGNYQLHLDHNTLPFENYSQTFVIQNDCYFYDRVGSDWINTEVDNAAMYFCEKGYVEGIMVDGERKLLPDEKMLKEDLAKIIFYSLFGGDNPTPADAFKTRFQDLDDDQNGYHRFAKVLSFLEYGDGRAAFDREFLFFNPGAKLKRKYALKAIMEAFNINVSDLDPNFVNPFTDIDDLKGGKFYPYIQLGVEEGLVNGSVSKFRPDDDITRGEVFLILYRLLEKSSITVPTNAELQNADNFYEPSVYNENNFAAALSLSKGNFSSYSSSNFYINGEMPLTFSHFYNSAAVDLPDAHVHAVQPFSPGWNHNYNMYAIRISNVAGNNIPTQMKRVYIVMPNGSMLAFKDNETSFTGINKAQFYKLTLVNNDFVLLAPNQTEYTFRRAVQNDEAPYMIKSIKDKNNNFLTFFYETTGVKDLAFSDEELDYVPKLLSAVKDKHDRELRFLYKANSNLLAQVKEEKILGRSVFFAYRDIDVTEKGYTKSYPHLSYYTDAMGYKTEYLYGDEFNIGDWDYEGDKKFLMTYIRDAKNNIRNADYTSRRANYIRSYNANGMRTVSIEHKPTAGETTLRTVEETATAANEKGNEVAGTSKTIKYYYDTDEQKLEKVEGTVEGKPEKSLDSEVLEWDTNFPFMPKKVRSFDYTYEYAYDSNGNATETKVTHNGETITTKAHYEADNTIDWAMDAMGNTTNFSYTNGNLTGISLPSPGGTTTISRNSNGTVSKIRSATGVETYFDKYNKGVATEIRNGLGKVNFIPDNAGRILATVQSDMEGNHIVSKTVYNKNDQIIETVIAGKGLSEALVTLSPRDPNGNIKYVENAAGMKTVMEYEPHTDFLKSETFGDATRSYTYYPNGLLKTAQRPDGITLNFYYDKFDRLYEVKALNKTMFKINYDTKHRIESYETFVPSYGTLKKVSLTYGNFDRVKTITDWYNKTTTYEYRKDGAVSAIVYPSGFKVYYDYYATGWLKEVKWEYAAFNYRTIAYQYYADGKLKQVDYPNNVFEFYKYDNQRAGMLQLAYTKNRTTDEFISYYGYKYNEFSELAEDAYKEPLSQSTNLPEGTTYWTYDDYNRITSAEGKAIVMDKNGNRKSKGNETYQFDFFDQLLSIKQNGATRYKYDYDMNGTRRKAVREGAVSEYYYGLGDNELQEKRTKTDGTVDEITYVWGAGLVARIVGGETYYLHTDIRGSVVALTNNSGTITHKYAYGLYGQVIDSSEPANDINRYRFMGKYGVTHEKDDLYYVHARFMDPTTGRFISEDPIWNTNLYSYSNGQPITNLDRNGAYVETWADIIGLVADVTELINEPSLKNAGFALWSAGSIFLPVPGSYVRHLSKVKNTNTYLRFGADMANTVVDFVAKNDFYKLATDMINNYSSIIGHGAEFVKAKTLKTISEVAQIATDVSDIIINSPGVYNQVVKVSNTVSNEVKEQYNSFINWTSNKINELEWYLLNWPFGAF